MGYDLYRSKELSHSLKGSAWANHKYIDKFWKNGKWQYIYNTVSNKVGTAMRSFGAPKTPTPGGTTINDQYRKTNEYIKIGKDQGSGQYKQKHYTEYTRNGGSWLTKKMMVSSGNSVTIYKDKGKISQAVEAGAAKGRNFISNLGKKKKKSNGSFANEYKDYAQKKAKQAISSAKKSASNAYKTASSKAKSLYKSAPGKAKSLYNTASSKAKSAYASGSKAAKSAYASGSQKARSAYNTASQKARKAYASSSSAARSAYKTASERARSAYNSAQSAARNAYNEAKKKIKR